MVLLTTTEAAEKWGISRRRVSLLCAEGRIEGAIQKSKMWLVPADAKKPEDQEGKRRTPHVDNREMMPCDKAEEGEYDS